MMEPGSSQLDPQLEAILADGPPWEHRHRIGTFFGLAATIKYLLTKPTDTLTLMHRRGRVGEALLFTALLQLFVLVVNVALARISGESLLPPEIIQMLGGDAFLRWLPWILVGGIFLSLLVKATTIFIALRLMGEMRYPWSTAFRLVAYTDGVASLLGLVPLVGGLAQMVVGFYLLLIGMRLIYGLSSRGVLGALLLAFALGLILTLGVAALAAMVISPGFN